jgi:ABC-type Zn uptake system ZnuABC Zn-binding protein ZnuA
MLVAGGPVRGAELQVCVTVPDLGSIARAVGAEAVEVIEFAKGPEDAHFVEAKPSFVKALSRADLYVQSGLDLEVGWAPALLQQARNARVLPGAAGYLDVSTGIAPLEVAATAVDRSMGDVHPRGNPHYLADPLSGLRAARAIRDKLAELRPDGAAVFQQGYATFERAVIAALVGDELARRASGEQLAQLVEQGGLEEFAAAQGVALGGWLGRMHPFDGRAVVADHNLWPYFARRFGIDVAGFMEPKPGVPPTTKHLGELVALMQARGVRVILAASYYDPRHARVLAERTGARVVEMAQQTRARPEARDYLAAIDYNVRQVAAALEATR